MEKAGRKAESAQGGDGKKCLARLKRTQKAPSQRLKRGL